MIFRYILLITFVLNGVYALSADSHIKLTNAIASDGVDVIGVESPAFSSEIAKLLTPAAQEMAAPFLPLSFVVINNSGKYIWGFTFIYTFPDNIAPSGNARQIRVSPSPGGPVPRELLFSPGSRYLITPVLNFYAATDGNGTRVWQPMLDDVAQQMITIFLARHSGRGERIEAALDSVIYDDGTIVGPDALATAGRINEMIQADRDLLSSLEGLTGENLRAQLSSKGSPDRRSEEYSHRYDAVAGALQQMLEKQGEAEVHRRLSTMKLHEWFPSGAKVRRK